MSKAAKSRIPGITVYPRGKRFAYIIYLEPDLLTGKRQRIYNGGYIDEEAAWTAAIKAKETLQQGRHVAQSRRTVQAFFVEWLDAIQPAIKPSTYTNYVDYLEAYVYPVIGERPLQALTVQALNRFYRHLLEAGRRKSDANSRMYAYWDTNRVSGREPSPIEIATACKVSIHAARKAVSRYRRGRIPTTFTTGLAPKTVKNVHRMIHLAFKDAVAWHYITYNPAEHASLPREKRRTRNTRPTPWTSEQLIAWLELALNDRYAALWMLVATTGMRRGELAGLRRSDLDLGRGLATVGDDTRIVVDGKATTSDGKTPASERTISLDSGTVTMLRAYIEQLDREKEEHGDAYHNDNRLFCYPNGKAPHPDTITTMFNRLVDRAGAPHIRLHDVRHTYATLSLDAGIDLKVVSDRLGHANVYVTAQIYGHRSTGQDRQAAETMAELIRQRNDQPSDSTEH